MKLRDVLSVAHCTLCILSIAWSKVSSARTVATAISATAMMLQGVEGAACHATLSDHTQR